jgi:uncharacterized protein YecT (DUF1311 family)
MFKKTFLALAVAAIVAPALAEEYDDCMLKAGKIGDSAMAVCMNDQTKRVMQDIKAVYEDAAKDGKLAKWSGGTGMQSGSLRSMFETWLNYRNKYCSFYTTGYSEYLGGTDYNNAECLMEQTKLHLIDIKKVVVISNSAMDGDDS